MRNETLTSRIRYQKYVCNEIVEIRSGLLERFGLGYLSTTTNKGAVAGCKRYRVDEKTY